MADLTVLQEDFEYIAASDLPFKQFEGSTIAVTGATGLIGSLLVKCLMYCNQKHQLDIKILAFVRNMEKALEIYQEYISNTSFVLVEQDLAMPMCQVLENIDYIVHGAAVTASREMVQFPVDNIQTAVQGTISVLELARSNAVKGMVYLSSMEVYGRLDAVDHLVEEHELGYVDLTSVRSCYPEGKRICECLCTAYAAQHGVNVKIARLAQTFGAGVLPGENRVFAQFAKSALRGEDIVLRTRGLSEGNYVYTKDALMAILLLLIKGRAGEAYNVSNEESHMTIGQMAQMVASEIAENHIQVRYDIPADMASTGYAPDVRMHLSSKKLQALGWVPSIGLKESYLRMMKNMEADWGQK